MGSKFINHDGIELRVYSGEKTLTDCLKHRNRPGLDTLGAQALSKSKGSEEVDELLKFARVCRVERVMRSFLEGMLRGNPS